MILPPKMPRVMARTLIVENGRLLVFFRSRRGPDGHRLNYYSFPGGEVEPEETPEMAAVRETREEMGVDVALHEKVAVQVAPGFVNHLFRATILRGTPALQPDSEEAFYSGPDNVYEVRWVAIAELTEDNLLYYANLLPVIKAVASGDMPHHPVQISAE